VVISIPEEERTTFIPAAVSMVTSPDPLASSMTIVAVGS